MQTIGEKISALRKQRKMTQDELAEKMGVSSQAVSKWETNMSIPDLPSLINLADFFGITLDELVRDRKPDVRLVPEEQRREMERVERDERNAAIRLHAGLSTWHWTLVALWLPFVVALMQGQRLWIGLCCAMLVCHSAFYLVNIYRWSKKF